MTGIEDTCDVMTEAAHEIKEQEELRRKIEEISDDIDDLYDELSILRHDKTQLEQELRELEANSAVGGYRCLSTKTLR